MTRVLVGRCVLCDGVVVMAIWHAGMRLADISRGEREAGFYVTAAV